MAATTTNRQLTQYTSDTPAGDILFIRDVPDWTKMLRRQDTPFLKMIDRASAPDTPMLKAEWGWGSPDPVSDLLNGAITTDATSITVDNASYFAVGHLVLVGTEQMRVESVNTSTNMIGVTRGFAGTTKATAADNATIDIIGMAVKELEDDPLYGITQGEVDFNYHSIIAMKWVLSERARVTPTYESRNFLGKRDEQELRKKMEYTAPLLLERALLFGQRALGSSSTASAFGGLAQSSYITTRTNMSSAPVTEYDLMNNLQTVWGLVGTDQLGKTIMTDMFGKRVINSWYNDSRRSTAGDSKISVKWDEIETDMGNFRIVVNWQLKDKAKMFVFNPEDFKLRPYASSTGWQKGKHATNGWYDSGFLRGDFTMIAQNPDSRLELNTYSTTASDYPGLA